MIAVASSTTSVIGPSLLAGYDAGLPLRFRGHPRSSAVGWHVKAAECSVVEYRSDRRREDMPRKRGTCLDVTGPRRTTLTGPLEHNLNHTGTLGGERSYRREQSRRRRSCRTFRGPQGPQLVALVVVDVDRHLHASRRSPLCAGQPRR